MHTQRSEWFSFLKSVRLDIPASNVVLPLLSESEDDLEGGSEENNNNDDDARDDELEGSIGLPFGLYVFGILASSLLCSHLLIYFGNIVNS